MAKECLVSTVQLHLGGLPRNCVARITDHPVRTSAVYLGHKSSNQTNKQIIDVIRILCPVNTYVCFAVPTDKILKCVSLYLQYDYESLHINCP